jgi:hypothetical protein
VVALVVLGGLRVVALLRVLVGIVVELMLELMLVAMAVQLAPIGAEAVVRALAKARIVMLPVLFAVKFLNSVHFGAKFQLT